MSFAVDKHVSTVSTASRSIRGLSIFQDKRDRRKIEWITLSDVLRKVSIDKE